MGNVSSEQREAGSAALRRLKLIQIARGPDVSPLRKLLAERVRVIMVVAGALLLWDQPSASNSLWLVFGVLLVVVGLTAPRDRSAERLDALVEFLESTQQLDPNLNRSVRGSV
jgi:hypothetical protein